MKSFGSKLVYPSIASCLYLVTSLAFSCDISPPPGSSIEGYVSQLEDGQRICLGTGNYFIDHGVITANDVRISGNGMGQTFVFGSGSRSFSIRGSGVVLNSFSLVGQGGLQKDRTFGILAYQASNVSIWSVSIDYFKISIGVVETIEARIQNVWAANNGDPDNESAGGTSGSDPHLWISNSEDVLVRWGDWEGQADGFKPGGDGELAAYNSSNVRILETYVMHSGASGIYLVNCDACEVSDTRIHAADGWGLDVVGGSYGFIANNNHITASRYGAVVFYEDLNGSGTFINNLFSGHNNNSGNANCSGINVRGQPSSLVLLGNSNADGPLTCLR